jgi:hypothetical protein
LRRSCTRGKQLVDALVVLAQVLALAQGGAELEVLEHRQLAEQAAVLRHDRQAAGDPRRHVHVVDLLAVEQHAPASRAHDAEDRLQRRRLARGVAAEQADQLAGADLERDPFEDPHLAVVGGDVVERQQRRPVPGCGARRAHFASASGLRPR